MNNYSFPKELRLRKRKDFLHVYNVGKRFITDNFIIFIAKNNVNLPRIGITVTRKYGKAVKRNRLKRIIREFFRLNKPLFKNGYDFLLTAKKECKIKTFAELTFELKNFLNNEEIYNF